MKGFKALLVLLLLVAGGLLLLLGRDEEPPAPTGPGRPAPDSGESAPSPPATPPPSRTGPGAASPSAPPAPERTGPTRQAIKDRGVAGTVVDEGGAPVAGATVTLAQIIDAKGLFGAFARTGNAPRRHYRRVETDAQGAFLIRYDHAPRADLFVTHPGHRTVHRPGVLIPSKGIKSLGLIPLARGCVVGGRVLAEADGRPVAGAMIRVLTPGRDGLQAVPGRERGPETTTDTRGEFRFDTLAPGRVDLQARARGYARAVITGVEIHPREGAAPVRFSLQAGASLAGVTVDEKGAPLGGVRVEAASHSRANPVTARVRSGPEGTFRITELPAGAYRLTGTAPGHARGTKPMARTGPERVALVLPRQAAVPVRVLGRNGRPLRAYLLELRSVPPGQEVYGKTGLPPRRIRDARAGRSRLTGVDPGRTYALRVEAEGYAMTFSEPFRVEVGRTPAEVTVRMLQGGVITGRVVGPRGRPVAGARVRSMTTAYRDNPFVRIMQDMIPVTHTTREAVTDGNGRFRLPTLTPQTYQLKVAHPDHPEAYKKPIPVRDGETVDAGTIALVVGVVIHGTACDAEGRPIAGGRVVLEGRIKPSFGAQATTDAKGRFRLPPAPPGEYKLGCSRPGDPLAGLGDLERSTVPITLTGQKRSRQVQLRLR